MHDRFLTVNLHCVPKNGEDEKCMLINFKIFKYHSTDIKYYSLCTHFANIKHYVAGNVYSIAKTITKLRSNCKGRTGVASVLCNRAANFTFHCCSKCPLFFHTLACNLGRRSLIAQTIMPWSKVWPVLQHIDRETSRTAKF